MIDVLKSIFGAEDPYVMKKEFFSLTSEFEKSVTTEVKEDVVDMALKLRNMLRGNIKLNRSDKIRILKVINRAKVRALLAGTDDGTRIFRDLDSVGSDILSLM